MLHHVYTTIALLTLLVISGCGGGDGRSRLSGKATFNGEPIVYGEIVFHPKSGPQGSATIRNGQFDTSIEGGQGIVRGPNTILITGYDSETISSSDENAPTESSPPLFANYELQADLTGDTYEINVPAEASKDDSK